MALFVTPIFVSGLSRYINEELSFRVEYERIFGRALPSGNVFCCFHANTDTPAARLYGNRLHCYACMRSYSVYDLLWRYDRGRIREVARSGVVPLQSELSGPQPLRVSTFTYRALDSVPSGVTPGSFEFYSWLTSD